MNLISSMFDLIRCFRPGMEVFVAGCAGESQDLIAALQAEPECARGVRFTGVHIPGANTFNYASLTPSTRQRCFFLTPELTSEFTQGKVDFLPLGYTEIWRYLEHRRFDWVIFIGCADAQTVSLGLASDFTLAAARGARALACIHHEAMRVAHAPTLPRAGFKAVIAAAKPLLTLMPPTVSSAHAVLAQVIAPEIHNGATVQLGWGGLQAALCASLKHHRDLRVHTGIVGDGVLNLLQAGALAPLDPGSPPVCTGAALGSTRLYDAARRSGFMQFQPVSYTHSLSTLASISGLVSVNSVIEIDLLGQVNVEARGGRQVAGVGGLFDFAHGARQSWGGSAIVATTATANRGKISRIRAQLSAGTPVSLPRHLVDAVATEFGLVRLAGLSVEERAQALISIADPQFREPLLRQWHGMKHSA